MIHGVTKSQTGLSDWTELNWTELKERKQSCQFKELKCYSSKIKAYAASIHMHIDYSYVYVDVKTSSKVFQMKEEILTQITFWDLLSREVFRVK